MAAGTPRLGDPRRRQGLVTLLSLVVFAVFVIRLIDVQVVSAAPLVEEALEGRLVTVIDQPSRGDIVDRDGNVLATSADVYHVYVNQRELAGWKPVVNGEEVAAGPLDAARILAPLLGLSEAELAAKLTGDKTFVYLAKDVTPETRDLIAAEKITGIGFEADTKRLYPHGNVAGNIVGFMAEDGESDTAVGMAGVERAYEELLTGTAGTRTYEKNANGSLIIPAGTREEEPAVAGQTIVLTIDSDIQYYAQERLAQALAETGASLGSIVVLDTQTHEVLALADSGSVDPRDPGATPAGSRGASSVEHVFEPGSTAKTITLAAALEEGVITPTSEFVAPFLYTTPNNETFRDSHEHPDLNLTATGILVESSNTGTIKIGELLSDEVRYNYMTAFGLGEPTDLGLPGESAGILHPWDKWDGRSKYATMYGQAVSITAIQAAQVYSIIANGGVSYPPTIVSGYEDAAGVFSARELAEPHQVISQQTADTMLAMLEEVTLDGTGRAAAIDGYRVAGKTGTAQAADENGQLTRSVASFVGIAPVDNPRIVVSITIYDPKTSIWGGEVAAPVFKDVATFALQTLRVAPSSGEPTRYPTTWE